jgi:short-subunit dehydrogenase
MTTGTPPKSTDSALRRRWGPLALITGASEGIGRAFAERLAASGFDLILVARRAPALSAAAEELSRRHGVRVETIAQDLSLAEGAAQVLAQTQGRDIGMLVASAGFGALGPFLYQSPDSALNMIDLNCRSVVALTHGIATRMVQRGSGGIVLFGSLVGFQGAPLSATYAATKSFVQSFAEGLAVELRPSGVHVLAAAPGPIASGFAARARMTMSMTDTPEVVARASLATLGRRVTVRPGALGKLLGWSLAMLPRWCRVRVMGLIMRGMRPR